MDPVPPIASPPLHPPTTRPTLTPRAPKSAWPGVLGTIAIVVGSLGVLINLWGAISPFFASKFMPFFTGMPGPAGESNAAVLKVVESWKWYTVASGAAGATCALLLIVAGAGLLSRKQRGVRLTNLYVILRAASAFYTSALTFYIQRDTFTAMAGQPGMASAAVTLDSLPIFTAIFSFLWLFALPAFYAIWLHRTPIKAETATWP